MEYDLRYAFYPITENTFYINPRVGDATTSIPGPPGTYETKVIEYLHSCTWYWFAIKSKDALGNWSVLSNVPGTSTMCKGGGGGQQAQQAGSPLLRAHGAELAVLGLGSTDPLKAALALELRLPEGIPRWSLSYLNAVEVGVLAGVDSASILLQAPTEDGAWRTRARIVLADGAQPLGILAPKRVGRIVLLGAYDLQQTWSAVEFDAPGADSVVSVAGARSSRLGDVRTSVDADGSPNLDLSAGDTLLVAYAPGTESDLTPQPWFFIVGPSGSEVTTTPLGRRGVAEKVPLPTAFALRQNQPNPFWGRTTIRFEVPVETPVRLEIFDAQGRLVRTLVDGSHPAGFHAVDWDHRTNEGHALGSGVYLYRIHAGSFRAQKKMVLLPR